MIDTAYAYRVNAGPKAAWLERKFKSEQSPEMLVFHLERMHGTIARLQAKVCGVADEVSSNPLDGKWSVKHNIGHLAELETVSIKRIEEILSGVTPLSPAIFETQQDYNLLPCEEVLNFFIRGRMATLRRYNELTAAQMTPTSLHPRLKVHMNVVDLAFFHAEHDDHHLVRINEIINTLTK